MKIIIDISVAGQRIDARSFEVKSPGGTATIALDLTDLANGIAIACKKRHKIKLTPYEEELDRVRQGG